MTIREVTLYQVVCDECGGTAYDMDAEYPSWPNPDDANERWISVGGIAVGGGHACHNPECSLAVLDSHPGLIARSSANGADCWWVIFDRRSSEYAGFYALGQRFPFLAQSSRSLANVMDEAIRAADRAKP